jgi:putative membrane protein
MQLGLLWLLVGLVILIWLVVVLSGAWLAATRPRRQARVPTDRAREILADRYARGEIDLEEYRDRLGAPCEDELSHR